MPRYGTPRDPLTNKKGMKGTMTGLPEDTQNKKWMPGVLFEPQEPGPVNLANCRPVEPTWFYQEQDMPTFRPRGPGDIEDIDNEPSGVQGYPGPKPKNTDAYYAPSDWYDAGGNKGAAPRTNKRRGKI